MATQIVELTSDEAKLLAGMNRVLAKQVEMQTKWQQAGSASKKAGDDAKKAGDDNVKGIQAMLPTLESYITGWASAGAVIAAATQALRAHAEEKKKGLSSAERLDDANRDLASVYGPGELAGAYKRADDLSVKHGIDRDQARRFLFSARSEGFEDYVDEAARFSGVMSLDAQAIAAGQIPALFDGKMSSRESVVLSGVAAKESRLKPDQFLKALPTAAAGGAAAGASPEETMSLVSVLASKFSSGDTAAQRVGSLGVKLGLDDRFKGKGIVDAVRRMQGDAELRTDFAGDSKELNEAIDAIGAMMPTIDKRTAQLKTERSKAGTKDDYLETQLREREEADPNFKKLRALRSARIAHEIERENRFAGEEAERETAAEDFRTGFEQREGNFLGRAGAETGIKVVETVGGGAAATEAAALVGEFAAPGSGLTGPRNLRGLVGAARDFGKRLRGDGGVPALETPAAQSIGFTPSLLAGSEPGTTGDAKMDALLGIQNEQTKALKEIAQTNGSMARGNNNANANAQAGRHIE